MIISPSALRTFLLLLMILSKSLLFLSIFIFPPTCGNMKIILENNVPDILPSSSKCSASRLSRTWHPRLIRKDLFSSLTQTASWFFSFSSSLVGSLSKHEDQMLLKKTLSGHSPRPTIILTSDAENEKLPSPRNSTGFFVRDPIAGKNIIILDSVGNVLDKRR